MVTTTTTATNICAMIVAAGKELASIHPDSPALANARQWWRDGKDESTAKKILADLQAATLRDGDQVEYFYVGDACPVHGTKHKKRYTFGSTMTAETEVCVFKGCQCAVSVSHDPCGTYPSVAKYNDSFANASGRGRLNAMMWADKFR